MTNRSLRMDIPLIAHVVHRLDVGGMENGLVNIVNNLPQTKYRHAVICLTESSSFAERIESRNVRIYELHKRPGKDLRHYFRFLRLIWRLKPSIVHTRNIGTIDLAPIAAIANVPIRIHGEHGWNVEDLARDHGRYKKTRRICDLAIHRYVAVSENISDWLEAMHRIPGEKICRICNGVDSNRFRPDGPGASLPFDDDGGDNFVIGTVGRLDPIKRTDLLIDAVARVRDSEAEIGRKLRLVIVGDGPEADAIGARVREAGLSPVTYLAGKCDDVAGILRRLDVFVLPSLNEGISNTILESMSTGIPVIAAKVGGNGELVVDGQTGFLVEPADADAIASALTRYLQQPDLRKKHGARARDRAVATFSLEQMVDDYMCLYDELIKRRIMDMNSGKDICVE